MSIKLTEGSYPQIDSKFTVLDTTKWNERSLMRHGHRLLELRLQEVTLRSENKSHTISDLKKVAETLEEVKHAMLDSTIRDNDQKKITPRFDMTVLTMQDAEKAIRDTIDFYNAKDKKRDGYTITLFVQHMITEKNGMKCWWTLVDKKAEGLFMILVKVDGKHVGKMNKQEVANTMDLCWSDKVCDISKKRTKVDKEVLVCPFSGASVSSK